MQKLFDQLSQIADSDASVLIAGESGTGKELVARALHQRSRRRQRPFVAVNCAALPDTLLESELFGHVKGAFTDARSDRKGLFLQAEGGTLLLDEIGEMPLAMQPKLLRALEENKLRPVGGEREVVFDARILATTNRDLETAVEERRFREDLFFRINVIQLELPPLRAAAPMPSCWPSTSLPCMPRGPGNKCWAWPSRWPKSSWRTAGPATSASSAT